MPIFFFDVREGDNLVRDDEGIRFGSYNSAMRAAMAAVKELTDEISHFPQCIDYGRIEINDIAGNIVAIIPLPRFRLEASVQEAIAASNAENLPTGVLVSAFGKRAGG